MHVLQHRRKRESDRTLDTSLVADVSPLSGGPGEPAIANVKTDGMNGPLANDNSLQANVNSEDANGRKANS